MGQTDLPVATVRKLVPLDMLVGCSIVNAEQAVKAQADGADYVAVGAIFPTPEGVDNCRAGRARKVKQAVSVPVVAIGGVTLKNVGRVKVRSRFIMCYQRGAGALSPENAARMLLKKFGGKDAKTDRKPGRNRR